MNTFQRMNDVINYIEVNMTNEIDYKKASQIAACPISLFQRFFVYITNITLSEYIRRRRLTLCAYELQENRDKIIDIALKYGYDSHSSFSRAFRDFHGISPSQARYKEVSLNIFPKLTFHVPDMNLDISYKKGVNAMDNERKFETFKNIRYRFDTLVLPESLKFVGLSTKGDFSKIEIYHEKFSSIVDDKVIPYTEIGVWENMTSENGEYDYVYGCLVNSLNNISEGLVGADTGFTKFAVMTVKCDSVDKLFEDETFRTAHYNFMSLLPPEYTDKVCPPAHGQTKGFATVGDVKARDTSLIEIYPADLFEKIEVCFYIPLKD